MMISKSICAGICGGKMCIPKHQGAWDFMIYIVSIYLFWQTIPAPVAAFSAL
jgi:hypothetical protein